MPNYGDSKYWNKRYQQHSEDTFDLVSLNGIN